jgi:septal ring factor EnvC (AmiA/AmiB activator)
VAGGSVTFIIHGDDARNARSIRLPVWLLRLSVVVGGLAVLLLLAGFVALTPLLRTAARVPGLERDVSRLQQENRQVQQLASALARAEARYSQIRQMMGGDVVPPRVGAPVLPTAPAIIVPASMPTRLPDRPKLWPLEDHGYLTRGQVRSGGEDEAHPGIDIAVPIGSAVLASGSGTVLRTGTDSEYGHFVLLQHADGFETMYGHLSRAVVALGDTVVAGQVIGQSGNSGRSTAPHLHFEIRRNGVSLDPLTIVKEAH